MLDVVPDAGVVDARRQYDELRLAHEAATAELTRRREALRTAETNRAADPEAFQAALVATREQRDRVVALVEQVKQANAVLTLAEARVKAGRS
jgi:hypothetical protein